MHDPIVALLAYLTQWFGNPGWAIASLSFTVRVALLPLTLHLARRALRQQQLALALKPEMEELRKRFEKNPGKLFEEMGKLHRKHGYTIFDLPTVLGSFAQLPIFLLLYRAIASALNPGERFYWIRNLASPDAWLTLLVLALTATGAYLAPNLSESSRTVLIAMQVTVTLFIIWKLAAGYGLYWASSSAVGVLQSWWLRREYAKQVADAKHNVNKAH
jgi:YidC/Oxa1 family membrane protein insertase